MVRRFLILVLLAACTATRPLPPRDDDPDRAAEYEAKKRSGTDDINRAYALARAQMRIMQRHSTARVLDAGDTPRPFDEWQFLGPGNIGGRTRALVIDPVEPRILYAAGVSGGIWKSETSGARWTPIADDLANIAVTALVMHPTDRATLYAGTGEGFFREEVRGTALPLRGNGIFVTHDAGATWTQLASTNSEDFHWVNDLVVSTLDPSRIYAATRSGVWRSIDAGASWTRVLPTTVKGGCLDLAFRGDTANDYLFASCGTLEQATVYRTRDGSTWDAVLSEPNMGRTSLAIAPSNPNVIYAMAASNEAGHYNQGLLAVYRSSNGGDDWEARVTNHSEQYLATLMLSNPLTASSHICDPNSSDQFIGMGWYCNTIAVDPTNEDRVWAAGVDAFRSDDGGRTWGLASYWWVAPEVPAYLHADQHAIVFDPRYDGTSNRTMYFANDGGVFRTDDGVAEVSTGVQAACAAKSGFTFTPLNHSYGVTQFYHGAVFPDGRRFVGGTQDNGTITGNLDDGPNGWRRTLGGDGAYVAIDRANPNHVYGEFQNGNLMHSLNGGATWHTARGGLNDDFLFVAPFVLDPQNGTRLWIGGRRLWHTHDRGNSWTAASTQLPAQVSAIAVAPDDSNLVLAGTDEGHIIRNSAALTATQSTAWTVTQPREGFVSSIVFAGASSVYATYAGFGGAHVWRSTDRGATWSALDSNLPDIPVHSIAIDPTRPGRLYLGTDLGVFVSYDDGASWNVENTGFASVVTETVVIAQGARGPAVYAFTHGRGAWRAELVVPGAKRRALR